MKKLLVLFGLLGALVGSVVADDALLNDSRLRHFMLSNMVDEVTGKNFTSKVEEDHGVSNEDKDNHTFIMPYYNFKKIGGLEGNSYGVIVGSQRELCCDNGIFTLWVGYDTADIDKDKLTFKNGNYNIGASFYSPFAINPNANYQYFYKINTRFEYSGNKFEYDSVTYNVRSYSYGADLKLGVDFLDIVDTFKFTPEVGLSYNGFTNRHYMMLLDNKPSKVYPGTSNFIDASAALKLQIPWTEKLRTNFKVGAIYNLYSDVKYDVNEGEGKYSVDAEDPQWIGVGMASINYRLFKSVDLGLNYEAIFTDKDNNSQAVFLRTSIWW